jgi:hypothetical protein
MKKNIYYLFVLLLFFKCIPSLAQEGEKPIVVSPLIGDTLSLEERDYYNLLPTINNFHWAVFYLNPDSTLNVKVTYLKASALQDTIITKYRTLKSLLLHLNAAENPESVNPVENKEYAGNEVSAIYNNGAKVSGNLLSATSSSLIIYSLNCDEKEINVNCATLVRPSDLQKLTVKSDFNLGRILYPIITGLAAIIIYNSTHKPEEGSLESLGDDMTQNFLTGFAIGLGGALVGIGLSYAVPLKISSEEEYSVPLNEDDIQGLSKIARYKDFEPYYNQLTR